LGSIRAVASAGDKGEFLSGKQHTILPISRRPDFTKFEHNTSIGVVVKTFGTEENFPVRDRFSKKRKNLNFFNVLRLQAAITPQ